MSYANALVHILQPLGVYSFREGSFSLGELQALGDALDGAQAFAEAAQRESVLLTAEDEGLSKMEALFRGHSTSDTVESRRAAILAFLQFGGDSFTPAALQSCLLACGVECLLTEVGVNHVRLSFPGVMGEPEGIELFRIIADDLLPCQLQIDWFFRWCTWGETEDYGFTWGTLADMTWDEWRHYTEGTSE